MRLHLGGHLGWYDTQNRSWLEVPLAEPTSLLEILRRVEVPCGEIALVVLNGRAVPLQQTQVCDADRVEIYPPVGGG